MLRTEDSTGGVTAFFIPFRIEVVPPGASQKIENIIGLVHDLPLRCLSCNAKRPPGHHQADARDRENTHVPHGSAARGLHRS